jgi:hypothetical protein
MRNQAFVKIVVWMVVAGMILAVGASLIGAFT